ncbi:MAG: SLC13 family permease [Thermoanaerobaculia bacterium]|nr:SLC13 family permease [Thermoanaerobaculia bacterium]
MNRSIALWVGPVLAVAATLLGSWFGLEPLAARTAGVTTLCGVWWIAEPIPIPVTSLLPFALFPLLGVLDHREVATAYGHTLILLLLGGFLLSTAMEKCGAHRRVAVGMVRLVGGGGNRSLVLGFMLATAVLSMWISNTATTLMLLPVALAVLEQDRSGELRTPLLLGIAYAASLGGLGTPIGTPPNVIFLGIYREVTGIEFGFLDWMKIGVLLVAVLVPIAWLLLTRGLEKGHRLELPVLGSWRPAEIRVLGVFAATAAAWMTRSAPFGGWSGSLGIDTAGDSTVALTAVVLLFLLPDGEGDTLLDWKTAQRIPWGLLILFGGGIAIARGFEASGLSSSLGNALVFVAEAPPLVMLLGLCVGVTFLTEVTSNTATTTLLMPILAAAGLAAAIDPARLMIPAAISASCAFMLPVATAPNAIVYGTGLVSTRTMAREGLWLNFVAALVVALICRVLLF